VRADLPGASITTGGGGGVGVSSPPPEEQDDKTASVRVRVAISRLCVLFVFMALFFYDFDLARNGIS